MVGALLICTLKNNLIKSAFMFLEAFLSYVVVIKLCLLKVRMQGRNLMSAKLHKHQLLFGFRKEENCIKSYTAAYDQVKCVMSLSWSRIILRHNLLFIGFTKYNYDVLALPSKYYI